MNFLTDEILKGTDWRALERAVARVISHCGWKAVRVVGRSGDAGGDVIGVRNENGTESVYVIQVKAVIGDNYVGPGAIQQVVDALPAYNGTVAIVATNGTFTKTAYQRRDELLNQGYIVRLWNGKALRDLLAQWPEISWAYNSLRDYQLEISKSCYSVFQKGGNRAQFVLATGLGKTTIAADIVLKLRSEGLRKALVLCHSQDLALQLEQSFWKQIPKSIPTRVFFNGEPPKPYDGINFGLYQTLYQYLNSITPETFDLVVVDEAHHAFAYGFRSCIDRLRPKFLLGMTATPWRGDNCSIDEIFGKPLAQVSIVDGMRMGFLTEVDYRLFCDNINWDTVPKLTKGELTIRDLNRSLFLPQRDDAVISKIKDIASSIKNPRIMIFCASIEHGKRFAELLTLNGINCRGLSGIDKLSRNRHLMEFTAGQVQAVTAVDVLNEGIDVPDVNVLVFLRCTHSRRIFIQQLGRGLRLSDGKTKVVALDFVADIRRIAELLDMNKQARIPKTGAKQVYFKDGLVSFDDKKAKTFFEEWLADIASLSEEDDSAKLAFP